jgi:hypothetical protein
MTRPTYHIHDQISSTQRRRRPWHDKHVISNLAFLPSVYIALTRLDSTDDRVFLELPLVVLPAMVNSIIYHRCHEPRRTCPALADMLTATLLFVYGLLQIFNTTSQLLLYAYCCLLTITVATHGLGIALPEVWDSTHFVGMHLVPGLWATLVARYNSALLL